MTHGPALPGIGSHQSSRRASDEWLTPRHVLDALGPFDLDPCASIDHPDWARTPARFTELEDGLSQPWHGRVWLNPPYADAAPWMAKMARHGRGIALLFARCDTRMWFETIWPNATGFLFLAGRLTFVRASDMSRPGHNSGGPSVLVAYGDDVDTLRSAQLDGAFVPSATFPLEDHHARSDAPTSRRHMDPSDPRPG